MTEQRRQYERQWRLTNRDRINTRSRLKRALDPAHANRQREYQRVWRQRHREIVLERNRNRMRVWRKAHPEEAKATLRKHYHKNPLRARAMAKQYREARKSDPVRLAKHRRWCVNNVRNKKRTDPQFRVRFLMRNRIWMALQRGVAKAGPTVELLGCTMPAFKSHIEALWKPGMTWDNYGRGGWHLDHKKPCHSFDLTLPEEQRKCFHFTNVQPLWQTENLAKGALHAA